MGDDAWPPQDAWVTMHGRQVIRPSRGSTLVSRSGHRLSGSALDHRGPCPHRASSDRGRLAVGGCLSTTCSNWPASPPPRQRKSFWRGPGGPVSTRYGARQISPTGRHRRRPVMLTGAFPGVVVVRRRHQGGSRGDAAGRQRERSDKCGRDPMAEAINRAAEVPGAGRGPPRYRHGSLRPLEPSWE
jgi:hypothetical protein